jgi:hypothetical protein
MVFVYAGLDTGVCGMLQFKLIKFIKNVLTIRSLNNFIF